MISATLRPLLNTLATSAITSYAATHLPTSPLGAQQAGLAAQVHGYTTAFTWAALIILAAAGITALFVKVDRQDLPAGETAAYVG